MTLFTSFTRPLAATRLLLLLASLAPLLAGLRPQLAVAQTAHKIVVPNNRATAYGGSTTLTPLGQPLNTSGRYQQVYAASQFSSVKGPQQITQLAFRPRAHSVSNTPYTSRITNIRVDLSTTKVTPDTDVSAEYARNIGADNKTVYSGSLTFSGNFTGALGSVDDFDVVINLQTPFIYEPSQGNLLLDVRNFSGGSVQTYFDMLRVTGVDSVSRVTPSQGGLTAVHDAAGTLDSGGLVTRFTMTPVPSSNWAPYVSAGADKTITLPASATLGGSVTDDARPNPPAATTASWTKVSGPGTVAFSNSAAAATTASFTQAGTYFLRLSGSDGERSNHDDVMIIVNRANQAPVVNAGSDQYVTLPNSVRLNGAIADDGLPTPPGAVTAAWTTVSGPGTVTFANSTAAVTTASFSAAGVYVLRLTGRDGALAASDDVSVTVSAASSENQAPSANAGLDQTVLVINTAALDGIVSDDGLPNPPGITTSTWSQLSGPGSVTFANPAAPVTTARFSVPGTYVMRLTASDGALSGSDDVTITVLNVSRVVVPNTYATAIEPRPGANSDPFGLLTGQQSHYQQVYRSDQFASITGPQLITQIAFRPSQYYGSAFTSNLSNIQIRLTTTMRTLSDLSTTFDANNGSDATIVYNGALRLSSTNTGPVGGPKNFDITIPLQRPFLYDPSKGNLLLDVRNFGGANAASIYYAVVSASTDSVARLYATSANSTSGQGDSVGLVTRFTFGVAP